MGRRSSHPSKSHAKSARVVELSAHMRTDVVLAERERLDKKHQRENRDFKRYGTTDPDKKTAAE